MQKSRDETAVRRRLVAMYHGRRELCTLSSALPLCIVCVLTLRCMHNRQAQVIQMLAKQTNKQTITRPPRVTARVLTHTHTARLNCTSQQHTDEEITDGK